MRRTCKDCEHRRVEGDGFVHCPETGCIIFDNGKDHGYIGPTFLCKSFKGKIVEGDLTPLF